MTECSECGNWYEKWRDDPGFGGCPNRAQHLTQADLEFLERLQPINGLQLLPVQ